MLATTVEPIGGIEITHYIHGFWQSILITVVIGHFSFVFPSVCLFLCLYGSLSLRGVLRKGVSLIRTLKVDERSNYSVGRYTMAVIKAITLLQIYILGHTLRASDILIEKLRKLLGRIWCISSTTKYSE